MKKLHRECNVSTMSIFITESGTVHFHCSPELVDKVNDCMKPLVQFVLDKERCFKRSTDIGNGSV